MNKQRNKTLPMRTSLKRRRLDSNDQSSSTIGQWFDSNLLLSPQEKMPEHLNRRKVIVDVNECFQGKHAEVFIGKRVALTPNRNKVPQDKGGSKVRSMTGFHSPNPIQSPLKSIQEANVRTTFTNFLPKSPNVALKSQVIVDPKNYKDQSYRELVICQCLSRLSKRSKTKDANKKCINFVQIYDWFKTKGDYFFGEDTHHQNNDPLQSGSNCNESPKQSVDRKIAKQGRIRNSSQSKQYMNYLLEKADETLLQYCNRFKFQIGIGVLKGILFQLLFALHVAQQEFRFMHNDLHMKNILIKYIERKSLPFVSHNSTNQHLDLNEKQDLYSLYFKVNENCWCVKSYFLVKITDFGLSRIEYAGELICNEKTGADVFIAGKDLERISTELSRIKAVYDACSDEKTEKKNFGDLKRQMKKSVAVTPTSLLYHPFFEDLLVGSISKSPHDVHDDPMIFDGSPGSFLSQSAISLNFDNQEYYNDDKENIIPFNFQEKDQQENLKKTNSATNSTTNSATSPTTKCKTVKIERKRRRINLIKK